MKFFTQHFNKHHLLHKPHRWFLALLVSPIHSAEMHYKKKYHLNYVHAKKLFVFDMILLASIFGLVGITIFWKTYDPTVSKYVDLSIQASSPVERTRSGEYLTYLITYQNNSEAVLNNLQLSLRLPPTFLIEQADPDKYFEEIHRTFNLPNLAPGSSGSASITGLFYGNVGQEYHILTNLSYQQQKRGVTEQKITNTITVLRDSVLETTLEASEVILSHSTLPLVIELKNTSKETIQNIQLPLPNTNYFSFNQTESPNLGTVENSIWLLDALEPDQTANLTLSLNSHIEDKIDQVYLELTPSLSIAGINLLQVPVKHTFEVVHPEAKMTTFWENDITKLAPGETNDLIIEIQNNGTSELENLSVSIPIPTNIVDINKLLNTNQGNYKNGSFIINGTYHANLKMLKPGESTSLNIQIPIKSYITAGNNISLSISPQLTAQVPKIPNSLYKQESSSPSITIGTSLLLNAQARYYTDGGDQLGRGPLPPKVGEETKYWALITLENTTSKINNLRFSAQLPNGIIWTGRSSVTHGTDLIFNPANRTISWQTNSFLPHETAGLYMELAFTPLAEHIGTTPLLLQNINASATDSFTGLNTNKTTTNIDISLAGDSIGQSKGVVVQ